MKINCIAIDDEKLALNKIIRFADKVEYLNLITTFNNCHESLNFLKENKVDLIFLDIQMQDLSGIEFAESLIDPPRIILTTAYESYALKAFDLGISDYLLKPISLKRFVQACEKVFHEIERDNQIQQSHPYIDQDSERQYLFVKSGKKMVKIYLDDILYIEGLKDYLSIITKEKRVIILDSFNSILETLDSDNFIRVHKSFIVALNKIDYFENNKININDIQVPVSNSYKMDLLEKMNVK